MIAEAPLPGHVQRRVYASSPPTTTSPGRSWPSWTARPGLAPRAWALANTGWPVATAVLERALERRAHALGRPWTRGIVPKRNAPGLRYARPGDRASMEPEYGRLAEHLLPA